MNPNICNNCGGDYEYRGGRWICRACGSYKPEELSNEEVTLLYTASQKLRLADFDEAEQAFDDIIQKYPQNPNGYWGRLMSKYGIKYEEDFDGRRIPTCYAASIESITSASDYLSALQYADAENRAYYESQAAYMESVRKEWVERASKEKPYDIFICYKDSDSANGIERTWDSVATQDLYIHLCNKGYRVFYSHESLRGKVGEKYEPYIFNALSTAQVMLVYASKPEYVNSAWLKNEWTRYKKRMAAGEKQPNSLLVACDGFSPGDLPRALSSMQCLNANQRSFYSDLDETIDRIIRGGDSSPVKGIPSAGPEAGKKRSRKKESGIAALCVTLAVLVGVGGWMLTRPDSEQPAVDPPIESGAPNPGDTNPPETEDRGSSALCVHKSVADLAVSPSCTQSGLTEGAHCELCGEVLTPQEILDATGHDIREWQVEREPEIGVNGSLYGACLTCGERIYESTPAYSDGLNYLSNDDGTCVVSGIGTCTDAHIRVSPVFDGQQVVGIADYAFRECGQLVQITLPEGLASIGHHTFEGCHGLQTVHLPESLTSIGDFAFANCGGLADLRLPASVSELGVNPFTDCFHLTGLSVDPENSHLCLEDGVLFEGGTTRLIWYFPGKTDETYEIPDGVVHVDACAFQNCTHLSRLVIPPSVEVLGDGGNGGFYGCTHLTEIIVDDENPHFCTVDGVLYTKDMTALKECPSRKSDIRIPESVHVIGCCAFDQCAELTEIILPENLTHIEGSAFEGCEALQRVVMSNGVVQIDGWAFGNCPNLTAVYYAGSESEWQAIQLGEENHNLASADIFYHFIYADHIHDEIVDEAVTPTCTEEGMTEGKHCSICGIELVSREIVSAVGHRVAEWVIDRTATAEEKGLRHGTCLNCGQVISEDVGYFSEGLEYMIHGDDTCTVIGIGACTDSHIRIPAEYDGRQVIGIADFAFDGCYELEWIALPEGMTHIGRSAFTGCESLEGISLPESLTDISDWVFSGCNRLTELFIPVGVRSIGTEAFADCGGLTHISVDPNNEYYTDRDGVLFDKSGTCLVQYPAGREESLYRIPEDVSRIDNYAFSNCRFLTEIHIPAGVTEMGNAPIRSFENAVRIVVDPANTAYCTVDGVLFTHDMTRLIACFTDGEDAIYRVPEGVTTVEVWAFGAHLREIVIPASVTYIGDFAFQDCYDLERITVAEDNPAYSSVDGILLSGDGTQLIRCPVRNSVTAIPAGVCDIGDFAFGSCSEITELAFPHDVTHIGNNAFDGCATLIRMTLSTRVAHIGQGAFAGCYALQEIHYTGSEEDWQTIFVEDGNEALASAVLHEYAAYGEHEHAERIDPAVEPTCTDAGYTEGSHCSICGEVLTAPQTRMPTGHTVDEWIIDREAEPGVKGSRHGTCTACGETVTETIKAYSVGLEYISNGDGTCTVIGRGSCTDLHIRIPHAFEGERVVGIGEWAFGGCGDIVQVTIPEGIETIQFNAFSGCWSMTLINLPESLASIGGWAFADCERLTSLYLPGGVELLDSEALRGCYNLASIAVSPDNPYFCDVDGILYDKAQTTLIKYPSAREDGRYDVPHGVTCLADWAFDEANHLTELYVPAGVTEIRETAINSCHNLTAIEVDPSNQHYASDDGILFTADRSCLVRYPIARAAETYSVPESVTVIGPWAFDATHLTELFIPASVEHIGEWAIHLCFELTAVTVSEDNPAYCSVDGLLYTKDLSRLILCPIQKTSVALPEGVKIIECRAFEFCNLTEIILSGDVEWICDNAFAESPRLERLVIPDSIVRIDFEVLRDCAALVEIGYMDSEAGWQAVSVDENNDALFSVPMIYNYRPLA